VISRIIPHSIKKIFRGRNHQKDDFDKIEITADGFVVYYAHGAMIYVLWDQISAIYGFKRDLGTTDIVCLSIEYETPVKFFIEINEEITGYDCFLKEIEERSLVSIDYWNQLVLPPFATNYQVIYEKKRPLTKN
jgi:hypothetical protein